jgi:hypothetical protein
MLLADFEIRMDRSLRTQAVGRFVRGALLLSALSSCGQAPGSAEPPGDLGFGLQLAPGTVVSEGVYNVRGPKNYFSVGSVTVGESADVAVVLGPLPIGTGYELDVSALASDGKTTCEGSTPFDVTSIETSTVTVHLQCAAPSGDLQVEATINICPMIDALDASPGDVLVGGTVTLASAAHDTDNGPSPLSYKWAINGAPLRAGLPPNLSFTCRSRGTFNFALTVSDGDITPGCTDTVSVQARCTAP